MFSLLVVSECSLDAGPSDDLSDAELKQLATREHRLLMLA